MVVIRHLLLSPCFPVTCTLCIYLFGCLQRATRVCRNNTDVNLLAKDLKKKRLLVNYEDQILAGRYLSYYCMPVQSLVKLSNVYIVFYLTKLGRSYAI